MSNDSEEKLFRIKLISSATAVCKSLLSDASAFITYAPDLHSIVNAALITGSFSDVAAAKHLREANSKPKNPDYEFFHARLFNDALSICRDHQKFIDRFFLQYKPDIHAVANALLITGQFDVKAIVDNICQAYASVDIDAIAAQDSQDDSARTSA
ncbi:MAG: hypothetical protein HYR87_01950 [Thaumarchaeota archaeon]|nr:hypothetical protein [Nitrososphaerota archaeon]